MADTEPLGRRIRIGHFEIGPSYADEAHLVQITIADGPDAGEGGDFSVEQLEAALAKFYAEHF